MVDQLQKDFNRFATLHTYYKHLPIYGKQFYFYKSKGEQSRLSWDNPIDTDNYHWHFSTSAENVEGCIYKVKFGPFLGGTFLANHDLLVNLNPEIHQWIKEFYPEYTNSDYINDNNNYVVLDIYDKENNKYWEEIKSAYLANPT
jgi:hypothetical protein